MKLIFTLVKEGVIELEKKDYETLVDIYDQSGIDCFAVTEQEVKKFNSIIERMKVNRISCLRLLGDELADRGENDYYTLKVLKKLQDSGQQVEIIYSNHGNYFLEHAGDLRKYLRDVKKKRKYYSLTGLAKFLEKGWVTQGEINRMVERYYHPNLRPFSYSYSRPTRPDGKGVIFVYTHAPSGKEELSTLANYLGVEFRFGTKREIFQTLSALTNKWAIYQKDIIENSASRSARRSKGSKFTSIKEPFYDFIWRRGAPLRRLAAEDDQDADNDSVNIVFVHGHDGVVNEKIGEGRLYWESYEPNMVNMDGLLGKTDVTDSGHYFLLC